MWMLPVSLMSGLAYTCLINRYSKLYGSSYLLLSLYNFMVYGLCLVMALIMCIGVPLSGFTCLMGILFGLATALGTVFKLRALSKGPLHLTNLITTASTILPAISGALFFGEAFSIWKLLLVFLLMLFIWISLKKRETVEFGRGWFLDCVISFFAIGSIGLLQKIHQNSNYLDEGNWFVAIGFAVTVLYSLLPLRHREKTPSKRFPRKEIILALVAGVTIYIPNVFNLRLSGLMPSQIFFPVINGGNIILTSVAALVLFRERVTLRQAVGLIGGIVSLILICIVS